MEDIRKEGKNYPDYIFDEIDKAEILIDKGLLDDAIIIYTKIIDNYPNEAYAYTIRGWLMHKKGDHKSAIIDYSNAIKRKPNIPNTIWLRANCYEQIGDLDNAIGDYKNYLFFKPMDAEGYLNLGLIHEYKKNYSDAIQFYRKSTQIEESPFLIEKINELTQRIGQDVQGNAEVLGKK